LAWRSHYHFLVPMPTCSRAKVFEYFFAPVSKQFMKSVSVCVLVCCLAISACELFGGGGGGGTGGGTGAFSFDAGFVWVREDDRSVFAANTGGPPQVLAQVTDAHTPSVSPDGKRVVFTRNNQSEIATVSSSGSIPSTVISATSTQKNLKNPVYSPDGQRLAFSFEEGVTSSIGVVNVDGTNFRRVLVGTALSWHSPSFSSDGKKLLVAGGNAGLSVTQFHWLDLATGSTTQVANTLGIEAQTIMNRAVLSPDNTKVVFDARVSSGATRIFVMDLAPPNAVKKVNEYTAEPNTNDRFPCFKSNTALVYNSDSGGNDASYEIKLDGTGRNLILPRAVEPWFGPISQ
jgi:Tol biopolymer transport system component